MRGWTKATLTVLGVVLLTSIARGQTPIHCEQEILFASDQAESDLFGYTDQTTAISGDVIIVGAPLNDIGDQVDAGSAYIFRLIGGEWCEELQILDPGGSVAGDQFGNSVDIDGEWAIVGEPLDNNGTGKVFFYHYDSETGMWEEPPQEVVADPPSPSSSFGRVVSIKGDVAIVGAFRDDSQSFDGGAAYVFRCTDGIWSQEDRFLPTADSAGDCFGTSVGINGDVAIVGATSDDTDAGIDAGSAYIYRFAGTWSQGVQIFASDASAGDFFGSGVAIEGNVAIVGAGSAPANTSVGAVYFYRFDENSWGEEVHIGSPTNTVGDSFGNSVALEGNVAIVGAPGAVSSKGAVWAYHYNKKDKVWTEKLQLIVGDFQISLPNLGQCVSLDGMIIAASAHGYDTPGKGGKNDIGAACLFDLDCNGNEIVDWEDIESGFSVDNNLNGLPDSCSDCLEDIVRGFGTGCRVGTDDLLSLLGAWGPCPEPCPPCPADLNGDCSVSTSDLLMLLAAWGPCS